MKRFVILIIAAVVLGGVIGGTFIGGITVGKDQGREEITQEMQDRTSQFASRFSQSSTEDEESDFIPPAGAATPFGRGGTMGTVEEIDANVITLKTMDSTINIVITESTTIQKTDTVTLDDIEVGANITVSGVSQDDGSIEATNISITSGISTLP